MNGGKPVMLYEPLHLTEHALRAPITTAANIHVNDHLVSYMQKIEF